MGQWNMASVTPRLDAALAWQSAVRSWQAGGCVGELPEIVFPDEPEPEPPPVLWLTPRVPPPVEALKLVYFRGRIRKGRQMLTKALLAAGALTRHQQGGIDISIPHHDEPDPPTEEQTA
jgi:hypothetical protein